MTNPHSTHYDCCHQPLKYAIQIWNEKYLVLKCLFSFKALQGLFVHFKSNLPNWDLFTLALVFTNTHSCSAYWKHGVPIDFKCDRLNPVLPANHITEYARILHLKSLYVENSLSEMPWCHHICSVFAILNVSTDIWI